MKCFQSLYVLVKFVSRMYTTVCDNHRLLFTHAYGHCAALHSTINTYIEVILAIHVITCKHNEISCFMYNTDVCLVNIRRLLNSQLNILVFVHLYCSASFCSLEVMLFLKTNDSSKANRFVAEMLPSQT